MVKQLLQILNSKVGDTNVPDLARSRKLLHLLPGLDEVPIWQVLLQIGGISRAGPVHQVQINVVGAESLQRGIDALLDTLVPWVVELGGQPDVFAGHTRVLDALANLGLISICKSSIDVAVARLQSMLDCSANFAGGGLPGAETDGGDLVPSVEGEGLPGTCV